MSRDKQAKSSTKTVNKKDVNVNLARQFKQSTKKTETVRNPGSSADKSESNRIRRSLKSGSTSKNY